MQIVIDIPKEMVKWINDYSDVIKVVNGSKRIGTIVDAIRKGTPLPKGHGRLIDADAVSIDDIGFFSIGDYQKMVHKLTTSERTIIEADKAESEG